MLVSSVITGQALSGFAKNLVAQRKTPPQRTLFKGGTVLTLDASIGDFTAADVLVEGSRIAAVGFDLRADDARDIDATGNIVMPGFVNSHHHAWLGLLRGLMPNVETLDEYTGKPERLHARKASMIAAGYPSSRA